MIDVNNLYTFYIKVYPEDKHKWENKEIEISGLIVADHCSKALAKVYEYCGVEYGKTICYPNVRSFKYDEVVFYNGACTTGFAVIKDYEEII